MEREAVHDALVPRGPGRDGADAGVPAVRQLRELEPRGDRPPAHRKGARHWLQRRWPALGHVAARERQRRVRQSEVRECALQRAARRQQQQQAQTLWC